jgi:16S rRNA (cytosine967-C5)-methyltransferase
MHAEATIGQLDQSVDVTAVQLSGSRHFLEFFSHKVSYRSRPTAGMALFKIVSGEKPREIAVQVLGRRGDKEFTEDLLERALVEADLSAADRRLCQELVYGVVRWQASLDWLIARKTGDRPQKPALRNLLRLGLYQIFWLERIPNHAAVHVTVELAKHRGFGPQAGFVNALLRGYLREVESTRQLLDELKRSQPHLGYSHPEWLVKRWQARWGADRTADLLAWNNSPPKTFARVNTLKIEPAKLLPLWREENVEYDFVRRDWFADNLVFELKSHPPMDDLPSFKKGFFYIQDPSTLLAVRELGPQAGETILDLCAAPGGKLSYIAQLMCNQGILVGQDKRPERLSLLVDNCARLGVTNAEPVLVEEVQETARDAVSIPYSALRTPRFDRVLLDAPCSNTGVMRRRVDLRWRVSVQEIGRLRETQLRLLGRAASSLKPGGTLVYSTCSLEPEENRQVVDCFLNDRPEFMLTHEREVNPPSEGVDGAYVARFNKI